MSEVVIYHNPRCSKSRQTLSLLEENGLTPTIRLYLDNPPTVAELKKVVKMLGISVGDLIRTKEALYKELGLDANNHSDADLLQALHDNPKLIERPIVINGQQARIGRPPENVLDII